MSNVATLTRRIARVENAQLSEKIAALEARIAELERDQRYMVSFDLRLLSREDRETLKAINSRMVANKVRVHHD